jgi:hypothetical protein
MGSVPISPFFATVPELSQQVVGHISDELTDLESLFLDHLSPFEGLWWELFDLHQLRIGEHHSDPIIQVVYPLSDFIFIHSADTLHYYWRIFIVSCMI